MQTCCASALANRWMGTLRTACKGLTVHLHCICIDLYVQGLLDLSRYDRFPDVRKMIQTHKGVENPYRKLTCTPYFSSNIICT